jgi:3-hydroxybutyryl-CoA dehydratase
MFSASFFSKLFGTELPGEGCVYAGQKLRFLRPIYLEDVIFVEVIVKMVDINAKKVFFSTVVKTNNKLAIDGEAEIFIP